MASALFKAMTGGMQSLAVQEEKYQEEEPREKKHWEGKQPPFDRIPAEVRIKIFGLVLQCKKVLVPVEDESGTRCVRRQVYARNMALTLCLTSTLRCSMR